MTKQPETKPAIHFSGLSVTDRIFYILGVGFGSGLSPKAPGTVASLAILVLVPLWVSVEFYASMVLIAVMSVIGIVICERTAQIMQVHDDSRIVWDEFAGQSIALLPCLYLGKVNIYTVLAAFILFRLFDIWKPWPIGYADRRVHGGLGIMLDDILAGLMALIVLCVGFAFLS